MKTFALLKLDKNQIGYIFPMMFYYLWLLCVVWLNQFRTLSVFGNQFVMPCYIVFFLAHSAGALFFAQFADRKKTVSSQCYKGLIFCVSLLTAVLTIVPAYSSGVWFQTALILQGFFSGFFVVFLQRYMYLEIPRKKRGTPIGYAFGMALTINFIFFVLLFPQREGDVIYFKTFFTAMFSLCAGVFTWVLYRRDTGIQSENASKNSVLKGKGTGKVSFLFLISALSFLFYLIIGIQDCLASFSWFAGGDFILYTRLFFIAGILAAGILCDLKGRHLIILLSLSSIILGLISTVFAYTGALAFICFSFVQLAVAGFDLFIKVIFSDMADYSEKPIIFISLGFILPYLLKQPGILAGQLLSPYGVGPVLTVSLLLIATLAPLIMLLFVKIRDIYVGSLDRIAATPAYDHMGAQEEFTTGAARASALPPSPGEPTVSALFPDSSAVDMSLSVLITALNEKYGFSERELQVLRLILLGQTPSEMAYNLYVSESTIRFHIRNILKKSGANTRVQLISMAFAKDVV